MKTGRQQLVFPWTPGWRVCVGMMRLVTSLAVLLPLAGCLGNWSDEDVVFRLAVPHKDAVELKVPGENLVEAATAASALHQGLNSQCTGVDKDNITCWTRGVAHQFNSLTAFLLDLVERITRQEPTQRKASARVWGPWSDGRVTWRFEMQRDDSLADGGFKYCLHVAHGRRTWPLVDRRVSCGHDTDAFYEVFSGRLMPDAETGSVKDGLGDMLLLAGKMAEHGFNEDPKFMGRYEFLYDNRVGQDISIAISEIRDEQSGLPSRAEYAYHRYPEDSGFMRLAVRVQLTCGGVLGDCATSPLETLALVTQWNPLGATRVDATANGGELTEDLKGWECSNADREFVARHYAWAPERDLGDASLCPAVGTSAP